VRAKGAAAPAAAPVAVDKGIVKDAPPVEKKDGKAKDSKDAKKAEKPAGTLESTVTAIDPEEALVIRFIRRHAVRALAQCRYPSYTDGKANITVRPLYMLSRLAVNDGNFNPPLSPAEYGEAVIGLTNMYSLKGVELDAVLNAIAIGTGNFARRKVSNTDTSTPWHGYAARLNNSFAEWQKVAGSTGLMQQSVPRITSLGNLLTQQVFTPMEQSAKGPGASNVNLEGVQQWLSGRSNIPLLPYTDIREEEKAKYPVLKPVNAAN
jgi:hypothetical protein